MSKFINLNNSLIIDVANIQSIEFRATKIGTLYSNSQLAKRYTQLTGKEVSAYPGTAFQGTYDQIEIELKSGHAIIIKDFDLKKLREYLLSLLESVAYFECADVEYKKPDSTVSIDGLVEVKARLETDYPLDLTFRSLETIDVKIEE